ncbi:MAG TPA: DnaJ domain-containing protein [Chloroflexota bacterium]|nr:DnaJ domain-containing protein [Chloroflexota bacterium]
MRAAQPAAGDDLYALLGVDRGAEPEVIDAAYRALARKYHPDVNRAPDAAERTRRLNDAYRTLHDSEARARYDATLARRGAHTPGAARPAPRPDGDRPVDLFGAALGDVWRRARAARAAALREAPATKTPARGSGSASRRLVWPSVALGVGLLAGATGATALTGRSSRALRAYWSAASAGRAAIAEARLTHETLAAGGYAAVAGNASFGSVATQLIAALDGATARLRGAGAIPAEAEGYHFLQLDDWREERELRTAQRDSVQNRSPDAWTLAADRESAWRISPLHTKAEVAAAQLAALAART